MKRFLAMLVAVLMALSLVTIPVTAEKDPEPEQFSLQAAQRPNPVNHSIFQSMFPANMKPIR